MSVQFTVVFGKDHQPPSDVIQISMTSTATALYEAVRQKMSNKKAAFKIHTKPGSILIPNTSITLNSTKLLETHSLSVTITNRGG